jgi:hypothetical protein
MLPSITSENDTMIASKLKQNKVAKLFFCDALNNTDFITETKPIIVKSRKNFHLPYTVLYHYLAVLC